MDQATVDRLLYHYNSLSKDQSKTVKGIEAEVSSLTSEVRELEQVVLYFQTSIQNKIKNTKVFIEDLINRGLEAIFGGNVSVSIVDRIKSNKVMYDFLINDNISKVSGGEESHGGGICAVISFITRFITSFKLGFAPILVMDESLAFVSSHYQERVSKFIKELCKEFDYLVILVSHQPKLNTHADSVFLLEKVDKYTTISSKRTNNNGNPPQEIGV